MRQKHKSTYLQPKCALKAAIYHSKTIKKNEIPAIINSKDRTMAGITAPPDGLYLNKVYYGGETFEG